MTISNFEYTWDGFELINDTKVHTQKDYERGTDTTHVHINLQTPQTKKEHPGNQL